MEEKERRLKKRIKCQAATKKELCYDVLGESSRVWLEEEEIC